ncbi:MAG: FAD-dependent oxidoreductase [Gammaproteobacteria bacterium]|nr:FAD-dependent oxidoreductase [Gammaproteobacteria bacterium]
MSVVIVGAGHAGGQVAASLRQLKYEGPITLVGSESYVPYQRPPLTKEYLRGEQGLDRVTLRPEAFYEKNNVTLMLGRKVGMIDRDKRVVKFDGEDELTYDKLVLATGSTPILPPIPGATLNGVHLLRTIDDVDAIVNEIDDTSTIGIIGGGYIGLEAAASFRHLGMSASVVEMEDRLLKRVATEELATFYANLHLQHGVDIHLNSQVTEICGDDDGRVSSLVVSDGAKIDLNLVIVGVGIRPNTELADDAGLRVENGICVNERCETEDANIYAVGDCTNHPNPLINRRLRLESVPNAMEQARVAAANIAGTPTSYATFPWFWSDQYDLKLQMVGFAGDRDETVTRGDRNSNTFADFHIKQGVLVGADAINSPREFMASRQLCGKEVDARKLADPLVDLRSLL